MMTSTWSKSVTIHHQNFKLSLAIMGGVCFGGMSWPGSLSGVVVDKTQFGHFGLQHKCVLKIQHVL